MDYHSERAKRAFKALQPVVDSLFKDDDIPTDSLLYALALQAVVIIKQCEPQQTALNRFLEVFHGLLELFETDSTAERPLKKTKAPGEDPKPN